MRSLHSDRIWASQGGLSRNKVAVGESAAGSPPNDRDRGDAPAHLFGPSVPPTGHLRTVEAPSGWAHSSAVECLLCKEDALGSNPSGSTPWELGWNRAPYTGQETTRIPNQDRCTTSCERGWEGSSSPQQSTEVCDETVCTCNPDVNWARLRRATVSSLLATVPAGGWLGSDADEGRAKLR